MPDSSENLDPKEATEAKLCAYLEGELSPADRTEIEKHLASNPQHRQLLAELAKTREWMRSIPTETAPADLAEMFQQQVERSLLLDDSTSESRSSMNRWPQVLLLAAILLLTVGLGVVIVAMLRPPANQRTFSLAKLPASAAATEPMVDRSRTNNTVVADASAAPAPVMSPAMPMAVSGAAPVAPAGTITESKPPVEMDKLATPSRDLSDVVSATNVSAKLALAGYHLPTDQKTICFVVSTDSTGATETQVRGFFGRHELAFDDALTGKQQAAADALAQLPENKSLAFKSARSFAATTPTSAPSEAIYVARGLTPLQLELLSASLSTDNVNQAVETADAVRSPHNPADCRGDRGDRKRSDAERDHSAVGGAGNRKNESDEGGGRWNDQPADDRPIAGCGSDAERVGTADRRQISGGEFDSAGDGERADSGCNTTVNPACKTTHQHSTHHDAIVLPPPATEPVREERALMLWW